MGRKAKHHGVELHGKSFRYRARTMEDGAKRVSAYKRWPFIDGPEGKKLKPNDPLRKENAYRNAVAFALADQKARLSPQWANHTQDPEGTLLEWLLRYQVEALELRAYRSEDMQAHLGRIHAQIDRKGKEPLPDDLTPILDLTFHVQPRAATSIEHDKSQIRTLIRMARKDREINEILHSHISSLGKAHFQTILARWSKGKAKPKTKRRLINTFSSAYNHHSQHYDMEQAKPWTGMIILDDGTKAKARAIPKAQLDKLEAELKRLHPVTRAAIEFLRWTGARRSEAAFLRWENIQWPELANSAPTAHFERTKAARGVYKARFVYLEEECVCVLARLVKPTDENGELIEYVAGEFDPLTFDWPKSGWVFPSPQNPQLQISGQTIYQAFVRSVEHAGIPHASPHHLRHTKATQLTAMVPQAMAQEMLGHDDAASFAIYRHLAEEAGYMVRDKKGQLVSADMLKSKEELTAAIKNLPKEERAAMLAELLAD